MSTLTEHGLCAARPIDTFLPRIRVSAKSTGNRPQSQSQSQLMQIEKRTHTAQEWEAIRPVFTKHYAVQGHTLLDTQSMLAHEHGFYATRKMYKRRIKAWGLNKYMKSDDKEVIAQFISTRKITGPRLQSLSYKGRPVRTDLVRRYCKRTKVHPDIADDLPSKADDAMLVKRTRKLDEADLVDDGERPSARTKTWVPSGPAANGRRSSSSSSLSSLSLPSIDLVVTPSHSTSLDVTERTMWHVQQYLTWHFACDPTVQGLTWFRPPPPPGGRPAAPGTSTVVQARQSPAANAASFFENLLLGLDTLAQREMAPQAGFDLVNRACAMATTIIMEQYRGFLKLLIMNFTDERWAILPALRRHLLQYLAAMCDRIHGPDHYFTSVLQLLRSVEVLDAAAEPVMKVAIDVFEARHNDAVAYEVCQMKRALADLYRRARDFDNASHVSRLMLHEAEACKGRIHADTRRAARRLADIHIDQGDYRAAEIEYEDVLSRSHHIDEATVFALHALQYIRYRHHWNDQDPRAQPRVLCDYTEHLAAGLTGLGFAGTHQGLIDAQLQKFSSSLQFREKWLRTGQYGDRILARWAMNKNTG